LVSSDHRFGFEIWGLVGEEEQDFGVFLGLPDSDLVVVALLVLIGVPLEERNPDIAGVLPLIRDGRGEVSKADLPVAPTVPLFLDVRGPEDGLNGRNNFFFGGLHLRKPLDNPRSCVLKENVVGAQGTLRLILGLRPGPSFRFHRVFLFRCTFGGAGVRDGILAHCADLVNIDCCNICCCRYHDYRVVIEGGYRRMRTGTVSIQ